MDFTIPDGEIVDNDLDPAVVPDASPGHIGRLWALVSLGETHKNLAANVGVEVDPPGLVLYSDETGTLTFGLLQIGVPFSTFVLERHVMGEDRLEFILLQERSTGNEIWYLSSKKLVLDSDPPEYWMSDDEIHIQRWARVLAFAALVNANGWFQDHPLM